MTRGNMPLFTVTAKFVNSDKFTIREGTFSCTVNYEDGKDAIDGVRSKTKGFIPSSAEWRSSPANECDGPKFVVKYFSNMEEVVNFMNKQRFLPGDVNIVTPHCRNEQIAVTFFE